jgi:multidrug resistance efflux pump
MVEEKATKQEENILEERGPSPDADESTAAAPPKRDPVKFWTSVTLVICLIIFSWHLLADKYTPYTSNGRVEAFVVPIATQVSGQLIRMSVVNNQRVTADQELAVIDKTNYDLAVQRAEAELQQASQTSAADVATVSTAQAKVAEAKANLSNAEVKGQRIIKLSKQGAASVSRADDARTRIEASKANLASAKSELTKAKSNLGTVGNDNARIRSALTSLETAKLDLYRTTIRAPADGIITNLTVDVGHYANAGAPIMTFIATKNTWVQADMRENSLGRIEKGDRVEMVLDAAPGKIIEGEVMSVGYGVSDNSSSSLGSLATVQTSQGWLRQAQHFPVLIRFVDAEGKGHLRAGGQVNVIVYTGEAPVLNLLGRIWIRLISVLSHIY